MNSIADLATGMVSRTEKHSSIPPAPPQVAPRASVYPKIDLKEIARAVNMYRPIALKMLGEALEGAAEEEKDEIVRKSHIPLPPASFYLRKMGFPLEEEDPMRKSFIPSPIGPNFGPVTGPQPMNFPNEGFAFNYQGMNPSAEPLSAFYNQQNNVVRSDISTPQEGDEATEGVAEAQETPAAEEKENDEKKQESEESEEEKEKEKEDVEEKSDKPESQSHTDDDKPVRSLFILLLLFGFALFVLFCVSLRVSVCLRLYMCVCECVFLCNFVSVGVPAFRMSIVSWSQYSRLSLC